MSRPQIVEVQPRVAGWDVPTNQNFKLMGGAPFPVYEHAGDLASLALSYPANENDNCFASVTSEGSLGRRLAHSDGAEWNLVGHWADAEADLVGAQTNDQLRDKINSILQTLRDAGLMKP